MASRIRLCAIAKDEGAYLADWVFHHLHAGFDGIEVWVNGTSDHSVEILAGIQAQHPQVTFRVADGLLERTLGRGRSFQYAAYAKLAARARRAGFTHAAFLDLDEYWTPADGTTSIHDFVPEDVETNVVSFPWCVDVPDPHRPPFRHPLLDPPLVQLDVHVKSVVRLDDRLEQVRTHTARTSAGTRLLVRDPFPFVDERAQQWGSTTPAVRDEVRPVLPEAFVLHALHRSQTEYVASLAKGMRQTGADLPFKTNRLGYVASSGPILTLAQDSSGLAAYAGRRADFLDGVGVDRLVSECEAATIRSAEDLLALVRTDDDALEQLRGALHGVADPELDRCRPGWDSSIRLRVDSIEEAPDGRVEVVGWAFATAAGAQVELALLDEGGVTWESLPRRSVERPDVAGTHPAAPPASGFRVEVPVVLHERVARCTLLARISDQHPWQRAPLDRAVRLP